MNPIDFKNKWTTREDDLNPIRLSKLTNLNLSKPTIDFLHQSGLPEDAPPYLSFNKDTEEIFSSMQKLTTLYDFVEKEFDKYVVIGSCNDGDFIVVNTSKDDQIEFLDHENNFASAFFNSNIYSLAKCLLVYRAFVDDIIRENGNDAYMKSIYSEEMFHKLKKNLFLSDEQIEIQQGFWVDQLEMDWLDRIDNLENK